MTTQASNPNTYEATGLARRRRIIATITVDISTHDPTRMDQTAKFRLRDLKAWLARHEKDIQNEMAWCDDITIDCRMAYADEE